MSKGDLSIFWYLLQFLSSETWSSCYIGLTLALLELNQDILYYLCYSEWCFFIVLNFLNFLLSPLLICIKRSYWFFELILYQATLLKVFFSCRSSLVEFCGSVIYTIISTVNNHTLTSSFPISILLISFSVNISV